jgi:hypothetical protein
MGDGNKLVSYITKHFNWTPIEEKFFVK